MTDDRVASYVGAFDGHLLPGRKAALLIVDMVVAYLDPPPRSVPVRRACNRKQAS